MCHIGTLAKKCQPSYNNYNERLVAKWLMSKEVYSTWTRSYEHVHFLPFFFPILISPQCKKLTNHRQESETKSMVIFNNLFHRNHSVMLMSLENIAKCQVCTA